MSDTATIFYGLFDDDTLGGRLSRARDAAGLSSTELARRIGVQSATVQEWERDRSQPQGERLSRLAGAINVSLPWLLHGTGPGPAGEDFADAAESLALHLERLKRLHRETADVIFRIERELARLAAAETGDTGVTTLPA